ncbi:hypothetical protein ACB092_02G138000 [Castanea dentata]
MFILLVLTSLLANVTASRDLALKSGFNVPASLETREGLVKCLVLFMELKFCSNELFLLVLTGQNSLSVDCCQVITTFTNKCWPFMLTSFGFNTKQGNLLQGYCDAVPRLASC